MNRMISMSDEANQTRSLGAAENSLILFLFAALPVCTCLSKNATVEHSILFRKNISLLVFFWLADKPLSLLAEPVEFQKKIGTF